MVSRGSRVRIPLRASIRVPAIVHRLAPWPRHCWSSARAMRPGARSPSRGRSTIGRAEDADLVLEDAGISRHHARIGDEAGIVTIEDLGSSNGTFVNGEPVEGRRPLRDGDEIQVGGALLQFVGGSGETLVMGAGAPGDPQATGPPAAGAAAGRPPSPLAPRRRRGSRSRLHAAARQGRRRRRAASRSRSPAAAAAPAENDWNLPALGAIVLGPASILLLDLLLGLRLLRRPPDRDRRARPRHDRPQQRRPRREHAASAPSPPPGAPSASSAPSSPRSS